MKKARAGSKMGRGGYTPAFFRKSAEGIVDKGVVKHSWCKE